MLVLTEENTLRQAVKSGYGLNATLLVVIRFLGDEREAKVTVTPARELTSLRLFTSSIEK